MSLIQIKNVNVSYGKLKILKNLNLNFKLNQITAIIGPSGSGKSTLLNYLAGFLNHPWLQNSNFKSEQKVFVKGESDFVFFEKHQQLGFVFQEPAPFPISIYDNIAIVLRERKISENVIKEKVTQVLQHVELYSEVRNRLHSPAMNLSGGQKQRLCLARTLVAEPKILLLDEPCASLDPISTQCIETTLLKLKSTTTIILVTHNFAQARRLADETLLLWPSEHGAELIEFAETKKMFQSPQHPIAKKFIFGELG